MTLPNTEKKVIIPSFIGWGVLLLVVSACMAAFVSVEMAVVTITLVVLAWWAWQQPGEAILLLVVIAPLLPMLKVTQTLGSITLIKDVLILVTLGRLVVVPLLTKKLPYRRNIFIAPLIALVIWVAVSTLRADTLLLGILRARDIVLYLCLYLAVVYLPRSKEYLQLLLQWTLISGLIVVVLAGYQWFAAVDSTVLRFDPVRSIWIPRLSSTLAHPSVLGEYLVALSALLLTGAAMFSSFKTRIIAGIGAMLLVPVIILTYTRAAWLGYATMLVTLGICSVMVVARRNQAIRWRWHYTIAALSVVAIAAYSVISVTPVGGFIRSSIDPTYASNADRLEFLVRLVAPMTNTEAIIGRGLGDVAAQNFREVNITTYDITSADARSVQLAKDATLVDNQYLKTFVEMGFIGLVLYGWIYWKFSVASWQLAQGKQRHQHILGLFSLGFLTAFVVQALFIDIWDIFPTNALFWIIAGLVSAYLIPVPENYVIGSR